MEFAVPTAVATVLLVVIIAFILIKTSKNKENYWGWSNTLYQGQTLYVGQAIKMQGQWGQEIQLVMQWDGNLVLYNGGQAIWASHTNRGWRQNGYECRMQEDGNLVVYDRDSWQAIWSSGTWQNNWWYRKETFSVSINNGNYGQIGAEIRSQHRHIKTLQ